MYRPAQQGGAQRCWYAVHTCSNFEQRVAAELASKDFAIYLPAYEEIHQWRDRQKKVVVPLFRGYVFVSFADAPELRLRVLQTAGVARILGSGDAIEAVPEAEIEAVRRLMKSNVQCYASPFLREGVRVRVKRGALKDLEGTLVRFKNHARLVIAVSLIEQAVAAEVDIRDVEPVKSGRGRRAA